MDETTVIEICRNAIVTLIMVMGPSLVIMMVVGTTISIFQTVTSISEQTLALVPKVLIVFASSILLMPYMLGEMRGYFEREIIDRIAAIGSSPVEYPDPPARGKTTQTPPPPTRTVPPGTTPGTASGR